MAGVRDQYADKTIDEIADVLAANEPYTANAIAANAEVQRRLTISQIEASEAAKETARYSRKSAKYILWSVIFLAASTFIAAISAVLR